MRMAIVENSSVVNVVESDEPLDSRFIPSQTAEIGDLWDGGNFKRRPAIASITRRQGRLALLKAGNLSQVETYIASIPDDTERMQAQIEYEADTWERSNPWVGHMLELLGLTAEQGDDLFRLGATF